MQISSLSEDKQRLSDLYESTKKELEALNIQLDEQLKEKQAKEDSLAADVAKYKIESDEKSALQTQITELEDKLLAVEAELNTEVIHFYL